MSAKIDDDRRTELEMTLGLLRTVLPSPRWDTLDFLDWVYNENPLGELVPQNVDRDGQRLCHIGGVPMNLRSADDAGRFLILYNSSAAPEEQGKGTYVKTLFKLHGRARDLGFHGMLGVTNAASTGPATKGFKARMLGALPAKLCVPTVVRSPGHTHHPVDDAFLDSGEFEKLASELDATPAGTWTNCWTPDVLAWRLRWIGYDYTLHVGPDLVAVSTRTTYRGVPVAVLSKVLPRAGARGPLSSEQMIAAICKYHRAPAAVYAGFNANVPVKGFKLRQDRLPSPLNLLFLSTSDAVDTDTFRFETFEFLDFDAY
jgi:hypothetical protein